jgi:hypothetical protein
MGKAGSKSFRPSFSFLFIVLVRQGCSAEEKDYDGESWRDVAREWRS